MRAGFVGRFVKNIWHYGQSCRGPHLLLPRVLVFPRPVFALTATTGVFSSAESISTSISCFCFSNTSIIVRAMTTGTPNSNNLRNQIQIAFEIGRIDDRDDHVGLWDPGLFAGNDIAGDLFVERRRIEAVKARQIDQLRVLLGNVQTPSLRSTVTPG